MKKISPILFFFLFFYLISSAQTATNYWVTFKDKTGSPYSVNKPEEYLSARAITRRERQHIPITVNDLPVNSNYINGIKVLGVEIKNRSKWFNAIIVSTSDQNKINSIKALPYVKSVEEIFVDQTKSASAKFDVEYPGIPVPSEELNQSRAVTTGGLNYGLSYKQVHQIGIDCMHSMGYMGQGMVIAQFDAGYPKVDSLPIFDSLRVNNQILGTWDFVSGNAMVYDDFQHGMNVLSCMGGNYPGVIIGTAPKAKYWLFRTEDATSESWQEEINWLSAAEYADSVGADVINSSLGYSTGMTNPAQNYTYADMNGRTTIVSKAAVWAARVGMFVTSSAGNAGGYPWYKITAPGDADSILTVGAIDTTGAITGFSSRGPTYDGRLKPNTVARGLNAIVASPNGGVYEQSGTSFSSPITAGAVACLWQANPTRTNMEILDAIQQSSSQYNIPDTIKGYGIPNFCYANTLLTGIDVYQLNQTDKLNVYPNPFNSDFDIIFYSGKKQNIQLELYDISGRIIYKEEKIMNANSSGTFNFNDGELLSEGIYILRVITSDATIYKKLVKQ